MRQPAPGLPISAVRRDLLRTLPLLGLGFYGRSVPAAALEEPWQQADDIVARIIVPKFPARRFRITDFGAVNDGTTLASGAFRQAITACHAAGGGIVEVPAGTYLTGAIHLLSNVNLHLHQDAVVRFSTAPEHYLPAVFTRYEGVEYFGYSPLIYAYRQQNIAITGKGILDGQASDENWWDWAKRIRTAANGPQSSRDALFEAAQAGVAVPQRQFSTGHYLRPPLFQAYACTNVLIEDVTVHRSPFWLLHPVLSENVTVRGVQLQSKGPNSDGCDPESCRNVLIENCFFDTGDDCIAIKSGRNNDGRRLHVAAENIVIRHCQMHAGHGGVVMGSEISGGVRNVFADHNVMNSPDLECGLRIKTNAVRGGVLENIHLRNTSIGEVRDAIVIDFYYEEGEAGKYDPVVRNIRISNMTCQHARRAFAIRGFERAPVRDLRLTNVDIRHADQIGPIEHVEGLYVDAVTINNEPFHPGT
jgi:polygalacturonase